MGLGGLWVGERGKNCRWGGWGFLLPVTAAGSELVQKLSWDDGGLALVSCRIWAGMLEFCTWIHAWSLCLEFVEMLRAVTELPPLILAPVLLFLLD